MRGSSSAIRIRLIRQNLLGWVKRNDNGECRVLTRSSEEFYATTVGNRNRSDDTQSQTCPFRTTAATGATGEALEDPLLVGKGNAFPSVTHPEMGVTVR